MGVLLGRPPAGSRTRSIVGGHFPFLHSGVWHTHDLLICSMHSVVCLLHLLSLFSLHRIPTSMDVQHMHIAPPFLVYESPRYHSWIDTYLDRNYDTSIGTNNDLS
jgi:hypothetical protein